MWALFMSFSIFTMYWKSNHVYVSNHVPRSDHQTNHLSSSLEIMDWKITILTYNLAMRPSYPEAVHNFLNGNVDEHTHLVAIGLQEVAHAETIGGAMITWAQSIAAWMNKNTRMVLLAKTFQATNQVLIFGRKQLIGQVKKI
ncbi:hypothetical protein B9Z55_010425 [Caenorhabditis nigoni]|uniref:Inositol polyphosphate-related phosphatase domain-containing protein n=1 Tax=Caenorhabditis nigoni TaxID=1611254 RepID=A0A2G5UFQ7_9PELO|nr:hypothetical protein B9Z55_010425 [Caenorhabditis nigoni]